MAKNRLFKKKESSKEPKKPKEPRVKKTPRVKKEKSPRSEKPGLFSKLFKKKSSQAQEGQKQKKEKKEGGKLAFRNWRIRNKIVFAFAVVIVALIYIVISGYSLISSITDENIPLLEEQSNLLITIKDMKASQRDFMLVDRINTAFFQQDVTVDTFVLNSTPRTIKFNKLYSEAFYGIKSLQTNPLIASNPDLKAKVKELSNGVEDYSYYFNQIHKAIQEKGFGRAGLTGEVLEAKDKVKSKLIVFSSDPAVGTMLAALDTAHIGYLYTNDRQYYNEIQGLLTTLNDKVKQSDRPEKYIAEYEELVTTYTTLFEQLIEATLAVGRDETEGLYRNLNDASTAVELKAEQLNLMVKDLIKKEVGQLVTQLAIIVIIIAAVIIAFAILISTVISKPISAVNLMLKDISEGEGDLTKILHVTTKEELGMLARLFNQFVEKIKNVVIKVKGSAATLTIYTQEIYDAIEQANDSIEQVSYDVQQMVDGLQTNASVVEETTASIQELSSSANMIASEAASVAIQSTEVLEASKQGAEKLSSVVKSIEKVKVSSETMALVISTLKTSSQEIVGIVRMINDIAEQTSLLALNASIEAARAGEHGRGFSVVAEEVRKLADQSKQSAFKINDIIKLISKDIDGANVTMLDEQALVATSVELAHETNMSFSQILALIEDIDKKIDSISDGANQQSEISDDMSKAIDELSNIMQQNAASAERIGENIETQVATFEEIGASMSELKSMSMVLQDETNRFIVD